MKDTKHIRRNFNSIAWVMPQGRDFGALGVPKGSKKIFFFQIWSCSISNRWGWQAEQNASNIFILGSNWWPWGKVKRSNIINMSISKIFIPGCVAQSVTCLATDACLTTDPGVASSIPARYHTFVEIDHEIISTVILLPSADLFKKGCCQLQA